MSIPSSECICLILLELTLQMGAWALLPLWQVLTESLHSWSLTSLPHLKPRLHHSVSVHFPESQLALTYTNELQHINTHSDTDDWDLTGKEWMATQTRPCDKNLPWKRKDLETHKCIECNAQSDPQNPKRGFKIWQVHWFTKICLWGESPRTKPTASLVWGAGVQFQWS